MGFNSAFKGLIVINQNKLDSLAYIGFEVQF